jgi:hypothetical protein
MRPWELMLWPFVGGLLRGLFPALATLRAITEVLPMTYHSNQGTTRAINKDTMQGNTPLCTKKEEKDQGTNE